MQRGPLAIAAVGILVAAMMLATPASAQGQPWITEISPETAAPGDSIDVQGYYLEDVSHVYVGSYPAAFEVVDDNRITLEVPEVVDDSYEVKVRAPRGSDSECCLLVEDEDGRTTSPTTSPTGTTRPTSTAQTESTAESGGAMGPDATACEESGANVQCNEFGRIAMESHHEIRGRPVEVPIHLRLDTNYEGSNAKWIIFSIRDAAPTGDSPVEISLVSLKSEFGDVVLQREEKPSENELNLWADAYDVPIDTPITLTVELGSTERGAFHVEALVMPFDASYGSVLGASGEPASLYSSTLLAVNEETARFGGIPTLGAVLGSRWGIAAISVGAALLLGVLLIASRALSRRPSR